METINSQIKENILFRIIENAINGDEEKLFSYANKFRKEFIDNPMFDEDTFRKLIHNYLHTEDGNWATMDDRLSNGELKSSGSVKQEVNKARSSTL